MFENSNQDQCKAAAQGIGYGYGGRIRAEGVMQAQSQDECAMRQSAKGALRVKVNQLRREADRLEALAKALPEELPMPADEALYDLIRATR